MSRGAALTAPGVTPESEVPMPEQDTCARCGKAPRHRGDSYCKPCRAEYRREWDAKNADKRRAYTRQAKARHPERTRARQIVARAIRTGKLVRPELCDRCKLPARLDAHHADYSKPLEVEWLCRDCHTTAAAEKVATPAPLADRIVAVLTEEWMPAGEIAAVVGVHPVAVGRLFAKQLEPRGVERRPVSTNHGAYYRLRHPTPERGARVYPQKAVQTALPPRHARQRKETP